MSGARMDFADVFTIASAGMRAQGERLRVIAQNLANAGSTGLEPGAEPYRRREVVFQNVLDRATGVKTVRAAAIVLDPSPFKKEYNPGHPAADAQGYVLMPNVKSIVETMDMREAQRSYEANLGVIQTLRGMISRALDVMRG